MGGVIDDITGLGWVGLRKINLINPIGITMLNTVLSIATVYDDYRYDYRYDYRHDDYL